MKPSAGYLAMYRAHIGNRLYIVFALSTLVALTEGLGITLLFPLLTALSRGEGGGGLGLGSAEGSSSMLQGGLARVLEEFAVSNSVPGILLLIALVFAIKGLLKFAEGAYTAYLESELLRSLRGSLMLAYGRMDYQHYTRRNTGHFVNIVTEQVQSLVLSFGKFKTFVATLIRVSSYFLFVLLLNWLFAAMAVIAGLFVLGLFRRLNQYVRALSRKTVDEAGALNHFVVQAMHSFKYLAATARVEPLQAAIMKSIDRLTLYHRNRGKASAFTDALQEPIAVTMLVVIIIIQVVVLEQAIAPILVAVLLIYRAMGQVVGLQSARLAMMHHVGSVEILEREFAEVARHQPPLGSTELGSFSRRIELDRVSFRYAGGDHVLHDISLVIPARRTVAIVGESGAGKSTLIDLLTLLLRPSAGKMTIDGVAHDQIDPASWRRQIGFVSQDTVVFDDTVANNICLWGGDYDKDPEIRGRVEQAAERASASDFIANLSDGFNTRVGERGLRLSGGQRQRLFIARELYKNPRLLILDEATSALDSESESIISTSVDALKGDTTVVMIAHRLATIRNADYVYVLARGRVAEHGTYAELTNIPDGVFQRMVALQML